MLQVDDDASQAVADSLGVDVIPTVQFWRKGAKLWEHKVGCLPLLPACLGC
jgi:thioredoxin-like negative regulator of GroEL